MREVGKIAMVFIICVACLLALYMVCITGLMIKVL